MAVDILLGLQWGDEGKGKVVDVLTPNYDVVARVQGGSNAGHTLRFNGEKYVLRAIPSGIFQKDTLNIIGSGVVLNPAQFHEEASHLEAMGHPVKERLHISVKAHLTLPTHRLLDVAFEAAKGGAKVGTTGSGIGPTYSDKAARVGIRVGEIMHPDFMDRYNALKAQHFNTLKSLNFAIPEDFSVTEKTWMEGVEYLRSFTLTDTVFEVNNLLKQGKKVLAEGAQGTMLDIDFGSYPFVTSSNTVSAGTCTGLGVAPGHIGEVYGISKAYCTRVGSGPFPTELHDEIGLQLAKNGMEFGAVTGRPRRCGWIDLVALKYAVIVNGVTKLILMKSDVLDSFDVVKVCEAYKIAGQYTDQFPAFITDDIEPIWREFSGWQTDLTQITSKEQFPEAFKVYLRFLEDYLEVPITIVSVGPDRTQTITL